ncbi:MAG TPA: cofactor-independent phosphoglycerate mutase [Victivallales bacterium]|nr:cofactor-independent phosphoglycerate mutase [Victivallales bacterium]HPO89809.1 cofactor-independent phosphoglycerate mutase [Victivallales bacterium]HRR05908.1 cofactor-independent phosphoglycerate mutase [Victivallales bacterium]HRR29120.1 cofactor-independent phosphoglycerate mutase [Victivallales bacterium]HRU00783.1 cofactor-independent phosphoglycerate mutase [Victivallales bacterium]
MKKIKAVLFLADGMADEPLEELNGKTPLEYANTKNMDKIARLGANGTFLSLPGNCPTSSDAANLSVLGYNIENCYPGRGPIEAASRGIELLPDDIAFRCNLVEVRDGILTDYSAGQIKNLQSEKIIEFLNKNLGSKKIIFYPGVSYRNILILRGKEFSDKITYSKPDSSHGERLENILPAPADKSIEAQHTTHTLIKLIQDSQKLLSSLSPEISNNNRANCIFPWSPGRKPSLQSFSEKYHGIRAAVISAVDVIMGIAACTKMTIIKVPGATGFIDTNYEGKAQAAIKALEEYDFVYLHVEAIDECSHMGKLDLKLKAIEDFDSKIVGPVFDSLSTKYNNIRFAVLPDHPVPIKLRKHTRTPVPVAICGHGIVPDDIKFYSENLAPKGALGQMKNDELMRKIIF